MNILSLTYPQGVPNLYEVFYSIEHRRRYFEECMLVTKQLVVAIDLEILWRSMATVNCNQTEVLEHIDCLNSV